MAHNNTFIWIIKLCFHSTLLVLCGYFHFYRMQILQIMIDEGIVIRTFGGSWRFLTIWGQYLTILYIFLSCMHDITNIIDSKIKHNIECWIHHLFYPICTLTTIIGLLFWSIFWIDKDLMLPKNMRPYYPIILNVFQHGGNGVIIWLDALICSKKVYHKLMHYLTSFVVMIIYQIWSLLCTTINGFHAYPFLNQFTLKQHLIFFIGVAIIGVIVQSLTMFLMEKLYHRKADKAEHKKLE